MRIACGPIWSRIVEASYHELPVIRRILMSPDGVSMLRPDWCYLSGLTHRLKTAGILVCGEPVYPDLSERVNPEMLTGVTLRDYQLSALLLFCAIGRGTLAHATGAGKSEFLAAAMAVIGPPTLCIVDTTASAEQLARRLVSRGLNNIGLVGGGRKVLADHNVVVIDSAIRMLQKNKREFKGLLEHARLLAFDEAHHLGNARTWQEVGLACLAPYRLGLTATPYDDEPSQADMLLDGIAGPVFDHVPSKSLRDAGYLSEPYAFIIPVAHGARVPHGIQDWNRIERLAVVEHEYRNQLIVTICCRVVQGDPAAKILLLVRRLKHGRFLLEELAKLGIKGVFSSGSTKAHFPGGSTHRVRYKEIRERFEAGEWSVLIGSVVYDESQDIPSVTDVVLGSAGRKTRRLLQRLGRGERVAPGKGYVRVWDFYDSQHWATRNQSVHRRKILEEEQIHIIVSPMLIQRVLAGDCSPSEVVEAIRGAADADSSDHSGGGA